MGTLSIKRAFISSEMRHVPIFTLSSMEDVMHHTLETECNKLMSLLGHLPVPHYTVAPKRRSARPKRGGFARAINASKGFKN